MAGQTTIPNIYQKQYQDSVVELLSRNKGRKLRDRCRVQNCKGSESTFFNTVGGTQISRTGNFLKGNFTDTSSGAVVGAENVDYTLQKIEISPAPIYAGNWVHENEYNKTMVNLDAVITQVQVDTLAIEEDKEVLYAMCRGLKTGYARPIPPENFFGEVDEALTLESFVEAVEIARMILGMGEYISIIGNKMDIVSLKLSNSFTALNEDFKTYFEPQTAGKEGFATGNIITWRKDILDECLASSLGGALTDTDTVGRILIAVDKAVGLATWYDTIEARIDYFPAQSEYLLKSNVSIGTELIDPQGIFVIQFAKPTAGAPLTVNRLVAQRNAMAKETVAPAVQTVDIEAIKKETAEQVKKQMEGELEAMKMMVNQLQASMLKSQIAPDIAPDIAGGFAEVGTKKK